MLIDWFTVGAQALNFLILAWLLKRFLYKPILQAIDAREQRIAAALADAGAQQAEAERERDELHRKNEAFDRQRAALLTRATDAATAERQRLLEAARQESEGLRAKQREALRNEGQGLSDALTRCAREEVFAIAGKVLADLAGTTLEERMADVFLRRLRELDAAEKTGLRSALQGASSPLRVRTAFPLAPAHRAAIATAVAETLGGETQIQFETAPDLIGGIEIGTDGQKVAWSIADYLRSLERAVDALLKRQPEPGGQAAPGTGQPVDEHGT